MSVCTKESDLVTAVLMYALRCLAEGDQAALRNMNFGPREIEALRGMTLGDLYRVESLRTHCLRIRLDRQVYWPMVDNLQRQRPSSVVCHVPVPSPPLRVVITPSAVTVTRVVPATAMPPSRS